MQSEQVSIIHPRITRPPTPPREACFVGPLPPAPFLEPLPDNHNHHTPSSSRTKKVGWTELTEYGNSSEHPQSPQSSLQQQQQQHQPPSAQSKPVKSILKASPQLQAPHNYQTFAIMLESIVQQLAGSDRTSKIDSYDMLSQVLRASDNVPDLEALREKMGLLEQFIKRDCTVPDTGLAIRALTLLSSFLYKRAICDALSQEFTTAIVEHAIKSLEDPEASKVVKYLMFVLSEQNFSSKTMNNDRVSRLIVALHNLNNNKILIKGKSIAILRIDIYMKLSRQSKEKMLSNTDWLKDLLTTMISDSKEARSKAISFGFEASLAFGTENKTSRAVMEIFQAETEANPGLKFMSIYEEHLRKMTRDKEQCASVPRIWSIIVLFLRCRPQQFEHWAYMMVWLKIIQHCFNCSDIQTRIEANYAWNRLVFATNLDHRTPLKTISILRTPLIEQLKRREKKSAKLRRVALGSMCNLLYYALRPTAMPEQIELYWKELVVEFMATLIPADTSVQDDLARQGIADACSILHALFDSTTPRAWVEERAVRLVDDANVTSKELPSLDPKWLRRNATIVFPVLEPLLAKLSWDLDDIKVIPATWQSYISSIASAAVKEIKVSNDTMACVGQILNFLFKTWLKGPPNLQASSSGQAVSSLAFIRNFEVVISTAIEGLGVLPFTERLLSMSSQLQFIVIATPSQRPAKVPGEIRSPLHHLFVLLAASSPGLRYDGHFSKMVKVVLSPFFAARTSSRAQVELAKELLKYISINDSEQSKALWRVVADFSTMATDTRDESHTTASNDNGQPLGVHYRNIVRILEVGIDLSQNEILSGWKSLFDAAVNSATLDAGAAGYTTTVIEPLSRYLVGKTVGKEGSLSSCALSYSHMLISKAAYPRDRQALDAARKRLWGTANTSYKNGSFDPYDSFYEFVARCMELAYVKFDASQAHLYVNNINAITALLGRCPLALLVKTFARLQSGLVCWIEDENVHASGRKPLSDSIINLWTTCCGFVPQLALLHSYPRMLIDLEPLICAGFESKHKAVVNNAILAWNSTFATCIETLEYSARLQTVLLSLRLKADIQLPLFLQSLPSEEHVEDAQPIVFSDSQNEYENEDDSTHPDSIFGLLPSSQMNSSPLRRILRETTPQIMITSSSSRPRFSSGKRQREATPEPGKKKARKLDHTPRLRHDDSQIQFQTIDSSPYGDTTVESQILTERQKEVKERQLAEAAMFPDLRSSPLAKSSARRAEDGEMELPPHRSSSKMRRTASPRAERQTTPSLNAAGEEDTFITSSPTPTRSLNAAFENPDLPSSPPQISVQDHDADNPVPDLEVLAPPADQITKDFADDTTTSVDPSAQIDPDIAGELHPMSTFESTPSRIEDTTVPSASSVPKSPVEVEKTSSALSDKELAATDIQPTEITRNTSGDKQMIAGTPKREAAQTLLSSAYSPKTPNDVFLDALSSPILSDNVFEDAMTSPRFQLPRAANQENLSPQDDVEESRAEQISTPLSDLDESSMLRVMDGIDNANGYDQRQTCVDGQECETKQALSPAKKPRSSPRRASSAVVPRTTKRILPALNVQTHQATSTSTEKAPHSDLLPNTSSAPSLIPETPFRGAEIPPSTNDEDLNPDSTIIVDTSALEVPYRRRKQASAAPTPIARRGKRKRKAEEIEDVEGVEEPDKLGNTTTVDMPDSQDMKAAVASKKRSPKKRKGRVSKEIVTSQGELTNTQADADASTAGSVPPSTAEPEAASLQSTADSESQDAPTTVTPQSMKEKLMSLIGDLAGARLSRLDVGIFEDLFMDAKEMLYGAGRRGREAEREREREKEREREAGSGSL